MLQAGCLMSFSANASRWLLWDSIQEGFWMGTDVLCSRLESPCQSLLDPHRFVSWSRQGCPDSPVARLRALVWRCQSPLRLFSSSFASDQEFDPDPPDPQPPCAGVSGKPSLCWFPAVRVRHEREMCNRNQTHRVGRGNFLHACLLQHNAKPWKILHNWTHYIERFPDVRFL